MNRITLVTAALAAVLAVSAPAPAQQPAGPGIDDPVVARVNDEEIRLSEVEKAHGELPQEYRQVPPEVLFPRIVEQLVNRRLLTAEGRKQNLQDDPEVKAQVEEFTQLAIQNAYIDREIRAAVSEGEVRRIYDETMAKEEGPLEVRASHILVESAEEGEALIEALAGGKDFAELAKEHSTGPSGPEGGDLGYFTRSAMVEQFAAAAFALEPGQVGPDPVQTQFGWHVIKVVDKRRQPPPSFEAARPKIEERLTQEFVTTHMAKLRADAEIEVFSMDGSPTGDAPKN